MQKVICIAICLIVNLAKAQQVYLQQADSLLSKGDSVSAEKLYERVLFFYPKNSIASYKLGVVQYSKGDYGTARKTFLSNSKGSDSISAESFVMYCRASIKGRYFDEMHKNVDVAIAGYFSKDSFTIKRVAFYRILAYLEQGMPDQSMIFCMPLLDSQGRETVSTALDKYKSGLKKIKKARVLSIFPGAGQAYSNDWRNAANAFLLNGSIITLSVLQAKKSPEFGLLLGIQLLPRYYLGNIRNAGKSAVFNNNKLLNEFKHTVLREFSRMADGD